MKRPLNRLAAAGLSALAAVLPAAADTPLVPYEVIARPAENVEVRRYGPRRPGANRRPAPRPPNPRRPRRPLRCRRRVQAAPALAVGLLHHCPLLGQASPLR